MSLKDLLESTLKEIDRQMQVREHYTPEQALIWTFAAQQTRDALTRLYGKPQPEGKPS